MALHLDYYGQNDGTTVPDVSLVGDPAVDQPTLAAAGYKGGRIMAMKTSATSGRGPVIVPCDTDTMIPYGVLINGGGEYATSIGPSGSGKAPVVRAMWKGTVDAEAYDTTATFVVGHAVYCGNATSSNVGLFTATASAAGGGYKAAVGICTHIPTTAEPWLGVASLL